MTGSERSATYERVVVTDVRVGDRIARARTHTFHEVAAVLPNPLTMRFDYVDRAGYDRPTRAQKWWRECRP